MEELEANIERRVVDEVQSQLRPDPRGGKGNCFQGRRSQCGAIWQKGEGTLVDMLALMPSWSWYFYLFKGTRTRDRLQGSMETRTGLGVQSPLCAE